MGEVSKVRGGRCIRIQTHPGEVKRAKPGQGLNKGVKPKERNDDRGRTARTDLERLTADSLSLSCLFLHPTVPSALPNKSHVTGNCGEPSACDEFMGANIPADVQANKLPCSRGLGAESSVLSGGSAGGGYSEGTFCPVGVCVDAKPKERNDRRRCVGNR